MLARSDAAFQEAEKPSSISDEKFLRKVSEILERLRRESEQRGHSLLASMLDVVRAEAQDGLRTEITLRRSGRARNAEHGLDEDDGVVRMAEKFAWRVPEADAAE